MSTRYSSYCGGNARDRRKRMRKAIREFAKGDLGEASDRELKKRIGWGAPFARMLRAHYHDWRWGRFTVTSINVDGFEILPIRWLTLGQGHGQPAGLWFSDHGYTWKLRQQTMVQGVVRMEIEQRAVGAGPFEFFAAVHGTNPEQQIETIGQSIYVVGTDVPTTITFTVPHVLMVSSIQFAWQPAVGLDRSVAAWGRALAAAENPAPWVPWLTRWSA